MLVRMIMCDVTYATKVLVTILGSESALGKLNND